jgi:hypothetical protein
VFHAREDASGRVALVPTLNSTRPAESLHLYFEQCVVHRMPSNTCKIVRNQHDIEDDPEKITVLFSSLHDRLRLQSDFVISAVRNASSTLKV